MTYKEIMTKLGPVKHMAVEDRPRERMEQTSAQYLSDLELVMVLLGSGTKEAPIHTLAKRVLDLLDRNSNPEMEDFLRIPGIGKAKACLLSASIEMGRRCNRFLGRQILKPQDLYVQIRHYSQRMQEVFLAVALNGAHEILSTTLVSLGTVSQSLVHPREVFAPAIEKRASALIVAHNHPSGDLNPSPEDVIVTKRIQKAGEILGIPVLDHLVFSETGCYSMLQHGQM